MKVRCSLIKMSELGGALKSPDEPDKIFETLSFGPSTHNAIPDEYNMMSSALPPRNQNKKLTCAAFAGAAINEILHRKKSNFDGYMSPDFIYFHRENKPSSGMYGRNVFKIMKDIGSVPEILYPYSNSEPSTPTNTHYRIAAKYKIEDFARVTTIEGLKRALYELGPCYMQLPLYDTRPQFWKYSPGISSSHALCVVGYNKNGFLLRNSWGAWNDSGYIVFPYCDWNVVIECWVAICHGEIQKYSTGKPIPVKSRRSKNN